MSNVVSMGPRIVGDGGKLSADDMLKANIGEFVTVALIGIDSNGDLACASTDGRPETLMLIERAKAKLVTGYED